MAPPTDPVEEPGLYLRVRFDPARAFVERAGRIRNAPRSLLRRPLLSERNEADMMAPASELILYVLERGGEAIDTFGWPFDIAGFYDRPSVAKEEPGIRGTVRRFTSGVRLVRVPASGDAAYLFFTRADMQPSEIPGRFRFLETPLGLYFLGPSAPEVTPPILGGRFGPITVVPLTLKDNRRSASPAPPPKRLSGRVNAGCISHVDQTAVDRGFNIVVLGDGFAEEDGNKFLNWATKLIEGLPSYCIPGLKDTEPFKRVWTHVNVRFVESVSTDSGITGCTGRPKCPNGDFEQRQTYFGLTGCFDGATYPGFVGTARPEDIFEAAEQAFPNDYTHLYVVLANCRLSGGAGFPEQDLVYLTLWENEGSEEFVRAGSHEFGHAIAGLADEYIACSPKRSDRKHANQATAEQVDNDTVPWTSLATAFEATNTANGKKLLAIERYLETVPESQDDWLGAFWGCQDFDPDEPEDLAHCDMWADKRGCDFYRPMRECRMRKLRPGFCRVCDKTIADAIIAISGP